MMTKIRLMDYQTRAANPCIGRERADLVLAGCAIFEAIRREWPCRRLRVADRGLREGILVQMMRADGHLRPCRDGSRPSQANSGWSADRPCKLRNSDKPVGKGNTPTGDRAEGLDPAGKTSLD
jgi:hypothetical protein